MKKLSVLLAKVHSNYDADPIPTNTQNVIVAQNIDLQPLEMDTDDYAPVMHTFGEGEKIVGATWSTLSFDVLLNGGGTPLGTAPNWGVLLRGCANAQVVNASTSVVYSPVSTGDEALAFYYFQDGVRQRMLGARGTAEFKWDARKAPMISFKFTGLNQPMTDASMPVPTLPAVPRPLAVNKANTVLTLGGYQARMSSLSIALNNDVQYLNRTNRENVEIVDRVPGGKCVVELPLVAERDFLGASGICTLGTAAALNIVHGATSGNIVTMALPKVQLLKPKTKLEQGILMLECDLHVARNSLGNDEYTITCT